ncbi:MAG: exosortase C-terminal domain/associated protein EpsI [Vicinamibacterales bacterium]
MSMRSRVVVLLLTLVAAAGAVTRADRQEVVPLRKSFADFPTGLSEWRGVPQPPLDDKVLDVLGVDDYLTRAYFKATGEGVGLYVGYWQSQKQGDTIHSPQNCLPGAGWLPVSKGTLEIDRPARSSRAIVNRYIIQKGLDRQLVLYWYQSHGRIVASEYWGKIFMVTDAVRLNRTDGAVVRVISPVVGESTESEQLAERRAQEFVRMLLPLLDEFLPV